MTTLERALLNMLEATLNKDSMDEIKKKTEKEKICVSVADYLGVMARTVYDVINADYDDAPNEVKIALVDFGAHITAVASTKLAEKTKEKGECDECKH